ncbi:MAG TPA: outer membrane beta-barrel protein [Longimicrobiales bacterium]|nr:outer membrane beta-barrel protein [Longimicrobiales bacterium]
MLRHMVKAVVLLLVVHTGALHAQSPFGMELRGGAAIPAADLGDASLKTGFSTEVTGTFRVMEQLNVYAGWDWSRFATDTPFYGSNYDVELTGYAFGLQFQHPLASRMGGWLRAGALYSHVELENTAGTTVADSGHELGWEVGGGLRVPVGERTFITPGVRYRTLSTELTVGQVRSIDLSYIAAEVGVAWTFGSKRPATVTSR